MPRITIVAARVRGKSALKVGVAAAVIVAALLSVRCAMVDDRDAPEPGAERVPSDGGAAVDAAVDGAPAAQVSLPAPAVPPPAVGPAAPPAPAAGSPAPVLAAPAPPDSLQALLDALFPAGDDAPAAEAVARADHGRHAFVLARGPTGIAAEPDSAPTFGEPTPTYTFKLLKLSRATGADGLEAFALVASLTIAEGVMAAEDSENECEAATELRARDVDRDGEIELTAIVAGVLLDYDVEYTERECVVRAVIAGADDLAPAFAVERERAAMRTDVWTELESRVTRTWRFSDADQDGHPDLVVVQTTESRLYEAPDGCDPDRPPTPEHRERHRHRVSWTCPYDAARDVWTCPAEATLAQPPAPAPP